jgi:small conductance mechanosensitive channel
MTDRLAVEFDFEKDCNGVCRWTFEQTGSEAWARVANFLVDVPLTLLGIALVAFVVNRLVRRGIVRFSERLAGVARSGRVRRMRERGVPLVLPGADPSERAASRAETIGLVLRSIATGIIWSLAVLYAAAALGLQLGPLLAGAGIAGVAVGFGAQSLVKDFLAGLFILMEDQYGVGDVVDLGAAAGTVEELTLRTTRLRDVNGTVWYVPNGEIRRVGNSSQQWARAVLDLTVPYGTNLEEALDVLKQVADEVGAASELADDLLEAPEVWGVEHVALDGVKLRLVAKTRPGAQFEISRILRAEVMEAFAAAGIGMPETEESVQMPTGDGSPPVPPTPTPPVPPSTDPSSLDMTERRPPPPPPPTTSPPPAPPTDDER